MDCGIGEGGSGGLRSSVLQCLAQASQSKFGGAALAAADEAVSASAVSCRF